MTVEGAVDHHDVDYIGGWVRSASAPAEPIAIDIRYRGKKIGHCWAEAGDDAVSRFRFDVPAFLPKGELAELSAWVEQSSQPLPGGTDKLASSGSSAEGTYSQFGGFWIDCADWQDELAGRRRNGRLSATVADQIERFATDGFVIIEQAVSEDIVDAVNEDIDRFWRDPPPGMLIETFEPDHKMKYISPDVQYRDGATKLLDIYSYSANVRAALSPPKVTSFLAAVFEDKPKVFQSLAFWTGSQQDIHKDSAYVKVDSQPMHLAASWLALEDVTSGTGELEYYVGSHRSPDYLFGGAHKWMENHFEEHDDFLASLHHDAERYGLKRASFLPKKGDVLIWHADLAHGGAPIVNKGQTRRSLVAHIAPTQDEPYYRRHNRHRMLETASCDFVSNYSNVS